MSSFIPKALKQQAARKKVHAFRMIHGEKVHSCARDQKRHPALLAELEHEVTCQACRKILKLI